MHNLKPLINPGKQCGAVLIISMVILLVMTVLGLAAAGSANMELRMAGNAQDMAATLQAAESAVEATLENEPVLVQAIDNASGATQAIRLNSKYNLASQPVASEAKVIYQGYYLVDGGTIGEVGAHFFEVTGTGSMAGNVTSAISQGVYLVM